MEINTRDANSDALMKNIYFNKYKPLKKIGEGSFGVIYKVQHVVTNEIYALKFEDRNTGQNLLESEAYMMGYLKGG
jgi:serine/threonine protein kinase